MRYLPLIAGLALLCSCSAMKPRSGPPKVEGELVYNPELLTDRAFSPTSVSVWGVKLGDPASVIPKSRINQEGTQGWLWCRDGSRYRIADGVVVAMGLWDQSAINRLNLTSPDQIVAKFGETKSIDISDPLRVYRYHDGKLAVIWNDREARVNAINISR